MFYSTAKFFLYASLFSVVVVVSATFFPFIGVKYYFFRAAVELSVVSLAVAWAFERTARERLKLRLEHLRRQPMFWAVTAFATAFLLACLFADNPAGAFWSNFERGEGGFQMIHYWLFFCLALLVLEHEKEWRRAFKLSLVAAVCMILYGVGAATFIAHTDTASGSITYTNPFGFIGPYLGPQGAPLASSTVANIFSPTARFQGSLGNPAYVAPYLMFAMCYALYLWCARRWRNFWLQTGLYGVLLLFFLVFFILSQTRGAFLGLIIGVLAFLAYLAVWGDRRMKRLSLYGLGLLVVIGGLLFALRDNPAVQTLPGARLLQLDFGERTAQTRLWTWNSATQGFKDRPILGWGPENFSTVFDKYFDPRHFIPNQGSETWFDRAHSVMFDYLAETGFVGFAAYVGLFVVFYWEFFRMRRRRKTAALERGGAAVPETARSAVLHGLLFAMPIAYLVQGLVLFDVLPIYFNLFLLFAFSEHFNRQSSHAEEIATPPEEVPLKHIAAPLWEQVVAMVAAGILLAVGVYGSYLPFMKSSGYIDSLRRLDSARSFEDLKALLAGPLQLPSPIGQEEIVRNTGTIVQGILSNYGRSNPQLAAAALDFIYGYYQPIMETKHGLSFTQNTYLLGTMNEIMYINTNDTKYLKEAQRYYEWGLSLSPTRPQFLYGLFDIYRNEKDVEASQRIASQILSQWPSDDRVRAGLAEFLARVKPAGTVATSTPALPQRSGK